MQEEIREKTAEQVIREKTALVFEGGSVLGIGHIGALSYWEKMGGYENITHVCGSSVGSIVAAAIAAKAPISIMMEMLMGLDLRTFMDASKGPIGFFRNVYRFYKRLGWHKGDAIEHWVEKMMFRLTGVCNITMLQLYHMHGIHLKIPYYSRRYRKTKYSDYLNDPNLRVAEVVRSSSSMQLFYQAKLKKILKSNGQRVLDALGDGGFLDNYPMHLLHEQEISNEKIMGFKLCSDVELHAANTEDYDYGLPKNIFEELPHLIEAMRAQAMHMHVHKADWNLTVKINVGKLKSTDFNMSEEQKRWLFESGEQAMRDYISEVDKRLEEGEDY